MFRRALPSAKSCVLIDDYHFNMRTAILQELHLYLQENFPPIFGSTYRDIPVKFLCTAFCAGEISTEHRRHIKWKRKSGFGASVHRA